MEGIEGQCPPTGSTKLKCIIDYAHMMYAYTYVHCIFQDGFIWKF